MFEVAAVGPGDFVPDVSFKPTSMMGTPGRHFETSGYHFRDVSCASYGMLSTAQITRQG